MEEWGGKAEGGCCVGSSGAAGLGFRAGKFSLWSCLQVHLRGGFGRGFLLSGERGWYLVLSFYLDCPMSSPLPSPGGLLTPSLLLSTPFHPDLNTQTPSLVIAVSPFPPCFS